VAERGNRTPCVCTCHIINKYSFGEINHNIESQFLYFPQLHEVPGSLLRRHTILAQPHPYHSQQSPLHGMGDQPPWELSEGLDFLNWRKVYNTLVVLALTYRVPVWYTEHRQKGLIKTLQITQNDRLCKITGVFKTTSTEPLHNLTGIPPISYLLKKLMRSYSLRLKGLPPNAKVRTVLVLDQC